MLLNEDDFRFFTKLLNSEMFCFFSQLIVTILVLWNQCHAPSHLRVSPFLFDLLQFVFASTRNFVWILIHIRVSPFLLSAWRPRDQTKYLFSMSFVDSCPPTGLSVLDTWVFGFGLDSLGFFAASSDFWTQINHPIICVRNIRWWSRWHIYFLVYDFFRFHNNYFRDTTSWEFFVKNDCDTSCLIEL